MVSHRRRLVILASCWETSSLVFVDGDVDGDVGGDVDGGGGWDAEMV